MNEIERLKLENERLLVQVTACDKAINEFKENFSIPIIIDADSLERKKKSSKSCSHSQ